MSLRPAAELDSQFVFDNSSQQIRTRGSIDVDDKINSDVEINILCTQQDSSVSVNQSFFIFVFFCLFLNANSPEVSMALYLPSMTMMRTCNFYITSQRRDSMLQILN